MSIRVMCLAVFAATALVACGEKAADRTETASPPLAAQTMPIVPTAAPQASGTITLDPEGLRISTAAPSVISFGSPRAEIVAAVRSAWGTDPTLSTNPDCPTGPTEDLNWPGLHLIVQNGLFVGWEAKVPGPVSTRSGIRVGWTRTQAQAVGGFAIEENPYDVVMFTADGVMGVLTGEAPDAVVESLWYGDTCIAS